jgi:hypothetical protein
LFFLYRSAPLSFNYSQCIALCYLHTPTQCAMYFNIICYHSLFHFLCSVVPLDRLTLTIMFFDSLSLSLSLSILSHMYLCYLCLQLSFRSILGLASIYEGKHMFVLFSLVYFISHDDVKFCYSANNIISFLFVVE